MYSSAQTLFPLNGVGWFGTDVINYAINAFYFINNAAGNFAKQRVGESGPVWGHGIGAGHRTNSCNVFVNPPVSHNSHAFQWEEHDKVLPELLVQTIFPDFFKENDVHLPQDGKPCLGNITNNSNSQTRAREGLSSDEIFRESEFFSKNTYFIFKEVFELHILWEPIHIMVRFDHRAGASEGSDIKDW